MSVDQQRPAGLRFHFRKGTPGQGRAPLAFAQRLSQSNAPGGPEHDEPAPAPLPPGVELARDTAAAHWVEESVARRHLPSVGHLVPDVFEAYARVLHPAFSGLYEDPVRWSAVAARTGRVVHPLMQFERIALLPDDPNAQPRWGSRPRAGHGPLPEIARALRPFTADPSRCWIAIWEGFGGLQMVEELAAAPKVRIPQREYFLFRGPLDAVLALARAGHPWQAPNLWWPDDRSWCVATDIDLDSTYVGGSRGCIEALLGDAALEVFAAAIEDRIDVGADEINLPVPRGPRRPRAPSP